MVITQNSLLSGGQCLVAGRAASTAGLFSLDPAEALHHGFRGLTVVALGILWDSPGRVPASHRPPRPLPMPHQSEPCVLYRLGCHCRNLLESKPIKVYESTLLLFSILFL